MKRINDIEKAISQREWEDAIALIFRYYRWRLNGGKSRNVHYHRGPGGTRGESNVIVGDDTYVQHLEIIILENL